MNSRNEVNFSGVWVGGCLNGFLLGMMKVVEGMKNMPLFLFHHSALKANKGSPHLPASCHIFISVEATRAWPCKDIIAPSGSIPWGQCTFFFFIDSNSILLLLLNEELM